MGRVVRALLVIGLLLAVSFASSLNILSVADISGTASIDIKAELPGLAGQMVWFNFSRPLSSVEVRDRSGLTLPSTMYSDGNTTEVSVVVPYDYLELQMRSDAFTSKDRLNWNISISPSFSEPLDIANSTIDLPTDVTIVSTTGEIFEGHDGLDVRTQQKNVPAGQRVILRATYQIPVTEPGVWDVWAPWGIVALAILAIGAVIWWRSRRASERAQKAEMGAMNRVNTLARAKTARRRTSRASAGKALGPSAAVLMESKPLFATLEETDKEIIREIVSQGGRTTQAHLHLYTHVPKATLSRHLASLENRGLLERAHKGNRKLVRLSALWQKSI